MPELFVGKGMSRPVCWKLPLRVPNTDNMDLIFDDAVEYNVFSVRKSSAVVGNLPTQLGIIAEHVKYRFEATQIEICLNAAKLSNGMPVNGYDVRFCAAGKSIDHAPALVRSTRRSNLPSDVS